ncbi:MAG: D-tyrosyl-tRNA(Tyr) deacylase [Candidatus Omnitrophica bacterium 4484_70.1]|nr:MAG: D-tyrosyl-tRNA(Tyr) deacylase [Candidatus Omnitrophica bacterium 4484_70.1]
MRAVIVRINEGKIFVKDRLIAHIDKGIAVFLGIAKKDKREDLKKMVDKVLNLRIFEDNQGKLEYSLKEKNYSLFCIPNFSLCASLEKGRRPSFEKVKSKEEARSFFEEFIILAEKEGINVKKGIFGEHMKIDLEIEGPLNIIIDI